MQYISRLCCCVIFLLFAVLCSDGLFWFGNSFRHQRWGSGQVRISISLSSHWIWFGNGDHSCCQGMDWQRHCMVLVGRLWSRKYLSVGLLLCAFVLLFVLCDGEYVCHLSRRVHERKGITQISVWEPQTPCFTVHVPTHAQSSCHQTGHYNFDRTQRCTPQSQQYAKSRTIARYLFRQPTEWN